MLSPPYRAAVIGRTGRGDYGHGLDVALQNQPKLDLVAVADENEAGRAAAAKRLGVERAYADYREMLDREKPQFVAVGPRWLDVHEAMVIACAERGINVLCEKPLAPDLGACDRMVAACERSHTKLAIAFQTRYAKRLEAVQKIIAAGTIGEVLELRGRGKEDRRGGGEDLMVLGVHVFDLFRALLGEPSWCFARVTEGGRSIGSAQVRAGAEGIGPLAGDRIDALYGFERSAAVAHFATAPPRSGSNRRFGIRILGSQGCIALGTGGHPPAYLLADPSWMGGKAAGTDWVEITAEGPGRPDPEPPGNGIAEANRAIVADLIAAVENDTQPRASIYDGRAAIEMVLACYAAHIKVAAVALPLADRARHPLDELRRGAASD